MDEAHQTRAPLILNPNEIVLLHGLTRAALKGHSPAAWPASLRHQMETVRNFARGAVKRPRPPLQAELLEYFLTFPDYFLSFPDAKVSKAFRELQERLTRLHRLHDTTVQDVLLPEMDPKSTAAAAERYGGRYLAMRRSVLRDRIVISVVNVRCRPNVPTPLHFFERACTMDGNLLKTIGVVIPAPGVLYFLGRVRHSSDIRLMAFREPSRVRRGVRSSLTGLLLGISANRAVLVGGTLLQPVPAGERISHLIGIFAESAVPASAARWMAHFQSSAAHCGPLTLDAGEL